MSNDGTFILSSTTVRVVCPLMGCSFSAKCLTGRFIQWLDVHNEYNDYQGSVSNDGMFIITKMTVKVVCPMMGNWQAVKYLMVWLGWYSPTEITSKAVWHYNDVIMSTMASKITKLTIVYSAVYSDADQRKHQSSASLAFVRGIHRGPVNSPHKEPVTRKMFPFWFSTRPAAMKLVGQRM